jgi:hypothetical protein
MPTYQPLTEAEQRWVAKHVDVARDVVSAYAGTAVSDLPTPVQLDAAWSAWIGGDAATVEDPNTMINVFGLAFGAVLVDSLDMEWVVVTDEPDRTARALPTRGPLSEATIGAPCTLSAVDRTPPQVAAVTEGFTEVPLAPWPFPTGAMRFFARDRALAFIEPGQPGSSDSFEVFVGGRRPEDLEFLRPLVDADWILSDGLISNAGWHLG